MEGLLIDNGMASVFQNVTSAHNGLARHIEIIGEKLEAKVKQVELQHEQTEAKTSSHLDQLREQANAQELRIAQLAQDIQVAQQSLQAAFQSETKRLGDMIVEGDKRMTQLASKNDNLKTVVTELASVQNKFVDSIIPQAQSVCQVQLQGFKSELAMLQEKTESRACAIETRMEQQQCTRASAEESLLSQIKGLHSQYAEFVVRVDSSEGQHASQMHATEKKLIEISAHADELQHELKVQALPKLKMDIEILINTLKEDVAKEQHQIEQKLGSCRADSTKQLFDLKNELKIEWKSGQDALRQHVEAGEARVAQQLANLEKAQPLLEARINDKLHDLHSKISTETTERLTSRVEEVHTKITMETRALRANIADMSSETKTSLADLRRSQDDMTTQTTAHIDFEIDGLRTKIAETGKKFCADQEAEIQRLRVEIRQRIDEVARNLRESDHNGAGRMYQLESILQHFRTHLKDVEVRLHGTGIEDCDAAWVSFRKKPYEARSQRPFSARAPHGKPLQTFQGFHRKVREVVDVADRQFRASEQASSSEDRCDAGCGTLVSLLRDLKSEAPTDTAAGAMEDAMRLCVMNSLSDGLAETIEKSVAGKVLPAGTALAAARAAHSSEMSSVV